MKPSGKLYDELAMRFAETRQAALASAADPTMGQMMVQVPGGMKEVHSADEATQVVMDTNPHVIHFVDEAVKDLLLGVTEHLIEHTDFPKGDDDGDVQSPPEPV